jgi:hypothetical protein
MRTSGGRERMTQSHAGIMFSYTTTTTITIMIPIIKVIKNHNRQGFQIKMSFGKDAP